MNRLPKIGILFFQCALVFICTGAERFTQDDFDLLIQRLFALNRQDPAIALDLFAPASDFADKRDTLRNRIYLEAALAPSQIPYYDKASLRTRLLALMGAAQGSRYSHELVPVLRLALADLHYRSGEIQSGILQLDEALAFTTKETPEWIRFRILEELFLLKRYARFYPHALGTLQQMTRFHGFAEYIHPLEYGLLVANQYMLMGDRKERDKALQAASVLIDSTIEKRLIVMYWMQRAWASIADKRPRLAVKELEQAAQSIEGVGSPSLEADLLFLRSVLVQLNGDQADVVEDMFQDTSDMYRKAGLQSRYSELLMQLHHSPFNRWITDVPDAILKQLSRFGFDESNLLAYSEGLSATAELLRREGEYRESLKKLRLSHRHLADFHKGIDYRLSKLNIQKNGKIFAQANSSEVSIIYYISLMISILVVVLLFLLLKILTQRHMNRQLAESVEKARIAEQAAEASNRLKSQFLANVSHELKTPMSGLVGMASLLDELLKDPVQRKYLSTIQTCSRNLLVLMNDLLDLGRMESGELEIEQKPFSPSEAINHSLDLARGLAAKKGLELNSEINPEMPGLLVGDPTRIGQILNNLLHNAIKFTPEGSVSLNARFDRTVGQSGNLIVTISDTGIGIPVENLHTIFEPFNRLNTKGGEDSDGSGLGLAICKKLAELMDGSISAKSEPGRGSSFTAMIPAKTPELERVD